MGYPVCPNGIHSSGINGPWKSLIETTKSFQGDGHRLKLFFGVWESGEARRSSYVLFYRIQNVTPINGIYHLVNLIVWNVEFLTNCRTGWWSTRRTEDAHVGVGAGDRGAHWASPHWEWGHTAAHWSSQSPLHTTPYPVLPLLLPFTLCSISFHLMKQRGFICTAESEV